MMVAPVKPEMESSPCIEKTLHSKGLAYKLPVLLKTIGYIAVIIATVVSGVASSCEVASGVWLSEWVDLHGNQLTTNQNLLIYSSFILAQVLLTIVCGLTILTAMTMTAKKFHGWLLRNIFQACLTTLEMTPVQKLLESFDKDMLYLDEKTPETFHVWLVTALRTPALLVVIFLVSPILFVLAIPLVLAFFIIQRLYLSAWKELQRLTMATSCPLSNLLADTLKGASSIRATRSAPHFMNRFHLKTDMHNNCMFLFLIVSRWLTCSAHIIASCLVLMTTVMAFYDKTKGYGYIGLAIAYAIEVSNNLTSVVYLSSLLNMDLNSLERLNTFAQLKQESEWEDPANRPPDSWPDHGRVTIENLSTAAEGMYPVLRNIDLDIQPGEKVAVIGTEESGVTTLLYALFRIIEPSGGRIIIDGVDLHTLGLKDLRTKLAIIPQENFVLDETIRQNLDPRAEYRDDELIQILRKLNLAVKLNEEVYKELSPEQLNLLSVVRCLLKKPKVVILQEPNAQNENLFSESTIITFSDKPILDFEGRVIKLLGGEIATEDYGTTDQ